MQPYPGRGSVAEVSWTCMSQACRGDMHEHRQAGYGGCAVGTGIWLLPLCLMMDLSSLWIFKEDMDGAKAQTTASLLFVIRAPKDCGPLQVAPGGPRGYSRWPNVASQRKKLASSKPDNYESENLKLCKLQQCSRCQISSEVADD